MSKLNVFFIVTSSVRGIYERFAEVQESIASIRKKGLEQGFNSIVILEEHAQVDEEELSRHYYKNLMGLCDKFSKSFILENFASFDRMKSYWDLSLFDSGVKRIASQYNPGDIILKLSGRYKLSDKFNIERFSPQNFTFLPSRPTWKENEMVYKNILETRLFGLGNIDNWNDHLMSRIRSSIVGSNDIEHAFAYELIGKYQINFVNPIGVTGIRSNDKVLVDE